MQKWPEILSYIYRGPFFSRGPPKPFRVLLRRPEGAEGRPQPPKTPYKK